MRSTPMPKLTRRTVNVAPASCPRLLITTPSNGWRRSFSPFGFLQPDVHAHGISGTESGDILASLALMDLLQECYS